MSNHVASTSSASSAAQAQTGRAQQTKKSSGASFADLHAAAVRTAKDEDAKSTKSSASPARPKGEKTEKVDGHSYAEIVAGPRNGMFLNESGNERSGQAFVMVKREGREFHVYGKGDDRAVFEVGRRTSTSGAKTTSSTPATT